MSLRTRLNLLLLPALLAGFAACLAAPGWQMLLAVFLALGLLVNLALQASLLGPLARLAQQAGQVSLGRPAADFDESRVDEIGQLAQALGRMRRGLAQAITMLEH